MKAEEITLKERNKQLDIPVVMRSFTFEDLEKAFKAGEVSKNRAILKDEGYDLNSYNLPKVDGFEDWIENYA
jgi:hypothetical protein